MAVSNPVARRQGRSTLQFPTAPRVLGWASTVGPMEGEGPLGAHFDRVLPDDLMGEGSWERAESRMLRENIDLCLNKAGVVPKDVGLYLGGDLLNQITATTFAARDLDIPFLGLYGACSTMAESLLLGSALVDGGYTSTAQCASSSHFCTAERQYRFPLELGNQRTPTAQRTVTGTGAILMGCAGDDAAVRVVMGTIGRVVDYDVSDANQMGAAMAPAAVDTVKAHFRDTGRTADDYDLIVTGDLGSIGAALLLEWGERMGLMLPQDKYYDCGVHMFSEQQDPHAGASGCGCLASVLCGVMMPRLACGELYRILAVGTGALLSPTSTQQGESIPCVAHAVVLERGVRK